MIRPIIRQTTRHAIRPAINSGVGGLLLPKDGLLLHARTYDADAALILDKIGMVPDSYTAPSSSVTLGDGDTYYVDATGGDDDAAGTSETTAWKTIAKVNGETFSAGDNILFKRGEVWREQLTVPSSGSDGSPILFGAYGAGALPVISGANRFTFVSNPQTASSMYHIVVRRSGAVDSTNYPRLRAKAGATTYSGGEVYRLNGTTWGNEYAGDLYFKVADADGVVDQQNTDDFGFLNIANASSQVAYAQGYTPSEAIDVTQITLKMWKNGSPTDNVYVEICADDSGFPGSVIATSASQSCTDLTTDTAGAEVVFTFATAVSLTLGGNIARWDATVATEPKVIWINGTVGTLKSSVGAISASGDWFWGSDTLSVVSDADPSAHTEVAQREYGLYCPKDYVTIHALEISHANGLAGLMAWDSQFEGGNATSTNVTVLGCHIHHHKQTGIYFYGVSNGIIAENEIAYTWNGEAYGVSTATGQGITLYTGGYTGPKIVRNHIHHNFNGIFVYQGPGGTLILGNVVEDNLVNQIDSFQTNQAAAPVKVYNNTVIHNPSSPHGHGIDIQDANARGVDIRNNIITSHYTGANTNVQLVCISSAEQSTCNVDHNTYFLGTGSTCLIGKLGSTTYATMALWLAALGASDVTGKDVNSLNSDPLLNADYTLQSTSPCIGAGTNPFATADGDQYDADGYKVYDATLDLPDGHWVDGVDIGAYAHGGGDRYFNHLAVVSGTTWADFVLTAPAAPELVAADDGTLYTAGVPNELDATARAAMVGPQYYFHENKGMAGYDEALTGTPKAKADKVFKVGV